MCLLLISEILGLFVNTLTAEDNYSVRDKGNLTQPIELQLSKNEKTFSKIFAPFLKCRSNFQHSRKKDDHHSLCIFKIRACQRRN